MGKEAYRALLEALDNESELTAWEWDFVNNLAGKPANYKLSAKQEAVLECIQTKLDLL